jgi:hypothetical protein
MKPLNELSAFDNELTLIQKCYASLTDNAGFHPVLAELAESANAAGGILT